MKKLPVDPVNDGVYFYQYEPNNYVSDYSVQARLEHPSPGKTIFICSYNIGGTNGCREQ